MVIDRLSRWTGEARAAFDAGDFDRLERVLDERDAIGSAIDSLLERVASISNPSATPGSRFAAGEETDLEPLREAMAEARVADALLVAALESSLAQIGREMDQMESDQVVRSAYGQAPPKRRQINLVR